MRPDTKAPGPIQQSVSYQSAAALRAENDEFRSGIVRMLVQYQCDSQAGDRYGNASAPKTIIQFWDNPRELPDDVRICMNSWQPLRNAGFTLACYDDSSARRFLADNLEPRHLSAFAACYHPAMRADYFRLCYIGLRGGCYVDADDVYNGKELDAFFEDRRLKLHPLCYDVLSGTMVPPDVFTIRGADSKNWIFYFNNNPLIAPPEHPIILLALARATEILTTIPADEVPEIQSTTGPGNLTASLVTQALICDETGADLALLVVPNWERYATSVWPLSYRADARNWRLSNRKPVWR